MPWPHTKTLVVSDKHRKSKIANRKMFISAQDKFLRFATLSFLPVAALSRRDMQKPNISC